MNSLREVFGALVVFCLGLLPFILFLSTVQREDEVFSLSNPKLQCYVDQIYLPFLFNGGFSESEFNNDAKYADGPLVSGQRYSARVGANDDYDFFYFEAFKSGQATFSLFDYAQTPGASLRGQGIQVVIYTSTINYHPVTSATYVGTLNTTPYSMTTTVAKAWYTIMVYSPSSTAFPYEIEVVYPTLDPSEIPTKVPLPKCTVTPLPSHTPKPPATELSPTPVTSCLFEAPGVGYAVLFPAGTAGHIRADNDEDNAMTTAVSLTPISPGFYQVTMYSYDNHTAKPHQNQPDEIWTLRLKNEAGTVIATAGPSTDIPDGAGNDCQPTYLENLLVLVDTAVSAEAYHAAYPATDDNPNSVNPDYALLIPVRMVAPPPTQTPAPTYHYTPTPTP